MKVPEEKGDLYCQLKAKKGFFKPFFSIDDFLMSNIAYGVYGEQYDYHVTYMNFAYGRFIVFLLKLFPKIPWYAVLFYIWIFTALTLLTYMIFKWNHAFMGKVDSEQAKDALQVADRLSDMVLFHRKVRENGTGMMESWEA